MIDSERTSAVSVGRYVLHRQIARGGMATIHIARLMGDEGFSRIVAAKRLLPEFAEDSEFVAMFLDEARIASRVHHPNVVPVLDVVTAMDEVVLVQEYVHGVPLHWLLNKARQCSQHVPVPIAVAIASQVLAGLHAAHEVVDELGMRLDVVHRDVSPQNVMVGTDGSARLLDFGIAKASMAAHTTREGTYKGKLAYSAPEQLRGAATRQSDLYSLAVLLWELLVGHRMHGAQGEAELVATIMSGALPSLTETLAAEHEWSSIDEEHWTYLAALEPIVKKGFAVKAADRYQTALEMDEALLAIVRPASTTAIAAWVRVLGKDYLDKQFKVLAAEEASWRKTVQPITTSRRSTPGELRREDGSIANGAVPVRTVVPSRRRGPHALIALLSVLVVVLAAGIVMIVRTPSAQSTAAAAPSAPAPATTSLPQPPPVATPVPVRAPEPPAPAAAGDISITIGPAQTEATGPARTVETRPSPPPARRAIARPPPVRQPVVARKPAAPPPPDPKVEQPAAKPAASCTPPYYFEGSKKIFKPACL